MPATSAPTSPPQLSPVVPESLARVAEAVKRAVTPWNEAAFVERVRATHRRLGLLDQRGEWAAPGLALRAEALAPERFSEGEAAAFVDLAAQLLAENPQMVAAFDAIDGLAVPRLVHRLQEPEGRAVILDVVAHALALDRLTAAICDDPRLLEECFRALRAAQRRHDLRKRLDLFLFVKLRSMELAMRSRIAFFNGRRLSPQYGRTLFPLNFLEAVASDARAGHRDNARAGLTLAKHRPGRRAEEPATGAGPTIWSDDHRCVVTRPPLQLEWADAYQVWNLTFCLGLQHWPHTVTKLLIPAVSGYRRWSMPYIWARATALYLHLTWLCIGRAEEIADGRPHLDWSEPALPEAFGTISRQTAARYDRLVAQARRR